jgi:hypothetical protein
MGTQVEVSVIQSAIVGVNTFLMTLKNCNKLQNIPYPHIAILSWESDVKLHCLLLKL